MDWLERALLFLQHLGEGRNCLVCANSLLMV